MNVEVTFLFVKMGTVSTWVVLLHANVIQDSNSRQTVNNVLILTNVPKKKTPMLVSITCVSVENVSIELVHMSANVLRDSPYQKMERVVSIPEQATATRILKLTKMVTNIVHPSLVHLSFVPLAVAPPSEIAGVILAKNVQQRAVMSYTVCVQVELVSCQMFLLLLWKILMNVLNSQELVKEVIALTASVLTNVLAHLDMNSMTQT
jgi:hypothetical protein